MGLLLSARHTGASSPSPATAIKPRSLQPRNRFRKKRLRNPSRQMATQISGEHIQFKGLAAEGQTRRGRRQREWRQRRGGAEREFRRALELNPNYALAHQWFAEYWMTNRNFDEAL